MDRLEGSVDISKTNPKLEESLSCVYRQIAVKYADLHDSTIRMCAKGVIRRTVELSESRVFFYNRLYRRLIEDGLAKKSKTINESLEIISEAFKETEPTSVAYSLIEDVRAIKFLKENLESVESKLKLDFKSKRIHEIQCELKKLLNE
jgi:acetyl-CoA carboxylase / biotin carboxylase 1